MTAVAYETSRCAPTRFQMPRMPFRLRGVYRPQADTRLLASVAAAEPTIDRARVLDVCTGTGALALVAAMVSGGDVTAVDISRLAVLTARLNAWQYGLPVRVRRASFVDVDGPFDLVLANPPYVPCPASTAPTGRSRCWDAGPDGRALLDPLCAAAPRLLSPTGRLLLVHSEVSGVDASLDRLRDAGLCARVVASRRVPFGPVMRARSAYLASVGLIERGQRHENLVVIRAERR